MSREPGEARRVESQETAAVVATAEGGDRLRQALARVESFPARNWAQRHVQGVLLTMLSHMAANCCEAGEEQELERWWVAVEAYLQVLECPRLLEKGGRTLMNKALDLNWRKLEKPGAMARLLKRRRKRRLKSSRARRAARQRSTRWPGPLVGST